ncbi:OmpH family outer membrane protein [Bdellovibrionota bacterium FG-2]
MQEFNDNKGDFKMVKTGMTLLFVVFSFSLTGLASAAVSAEDIKVGVVDMQKALQTVDTGKKARSELEKDFNAKKKELTTEEAAIKKMGEEFKKQSLVMNEEARMKKQAELQERIMKFQENTARSQTDIQRKEHELTQPIVTKLRTIIGDVAKQKGLAMVLEKNENMVLFSLDKDDLTTEVIAAYNKQAKN